MGHTKEVTTKRGVVYVSEFSSFDLLHTTVMDNIVTIPQLLAVVVIALIVYRLLYGYIFIEPLVDWDEIEHPPRPLDSFELYDLSSPTR
jgi:hypothetical protein